MRARGDRDLRGTAQSPALDDRPAPRRLIRFLDLLCAGGLFLLAIAASMLIPKTYTGRIWIYGTNLALLFAAMLNLLRIQHASGIARVFCMIANVAMLAFFVAVMASIGLSETLANAQIPAVAALLLLETAFSLRRTA